MIDPHCQELGKDNCSSQSRVVFYILLVMALIVFVQGAVNVKILYDKKRFKYISLLGYYISSLVTLASNTSLLTLLIVLFMFFLDNLHPWEGCAYIFFMTFPLYGIMICALTYISHV